MRRSAGLLALALLGCPSNTSNVNGTLRANQVTLFEAQLWQDERCTEGEGFANCCTRHDSYCLDFHDYTVADVEVQGARIAILFSVDSGNTLLVSHDSGATWKQVAVGSVGGLAEAQSMTLHFAGDALYLMVQTKLDSPYGGRVVVRPYLVDLETGQTTWVDGVELLASPPAFSASDGTSYGVLLHLQDARDPSTPCMALFESWKPGGAVVRKDVATGLPTCTERAIASATEIHRLGMVFADDGSKGSVCRVTADAVAQTAGGICSSLGQWPAARDTTFPRRYAAYADERTPMLGVFSVDGGAWASLGASSEWISLGAGVPDRNESMGWRQRYPGLVPIHDGETPRLVRVNRDAGVDEVDLPLSPCTGTGSTCFDPKSALVFHGTVGDLLWAEPPGNDEFLMIYVHDLAPGINQYKPIFTVSREKATYRHVDPWPTPSLLGPPGYPNAQPAGRVEEVCLKLLACGGTTRDFYGCVGRYLTQFEPIHTGYDAALALARAASCADPVMTQGGLDCAMRGGAPMSGGGCNYGGPTSSGCGVCAGQVALDCSGLFQGGQVPVRCDAAPGLSCQAGRCASSTPCTATTTGVPICQGNVGVICGAPGTLQSTHCDELNMLCDASARPPGWSPCVGKGTPRFSTTNVPLHCEGASTVMWEINGEKWADCTTLGFSGCSGGRCVP